MRGPGGSAAPAPRECEYALIMTNVGSIRGRRSRRPASRLPASRLPASRLTAALVAGTALVGGLAALVPAGPARADQPGGIMNSVDMIGARALWERGITGQGTVVVVIDSGVETSHPFLDGKVIDEACVGISVGGRTGDCGGGADFATGEGTAAPDYTDEDANHGTHVAGTIAGNNGEAYGVAPDAKIAAILVKSPDGFDEDEDNCGEGDPNCASALNDSLTRAYSHVMELAQQYRVVAVNMSLGAGEYSGICDEQTPGGAALSEAFQAAQASGIANVVASGNERFDDRRIKESNASKAKKK